MAETIIMSNDLLNRVNKEINDARSVGYSAGVASSDKYWRVYLDQLRIETRRQQASACWGSFGFGVILMLCVQLVIHFSLGWL